MVASYDKVLRDSLLPSKGSSKSVIHPTWFQKEDTGLYAHILTRLARMTPCPTDVLHDMITQGGTFTKYLDFSEPVSKARFLLTRFALRDAQTLLKSERRHAVHHRSYARLPSDEVDVDVLHSEHTGSAIRSLLEYWGAPKSLSHEDYESSGLSAKVKYLAYFLAHFLANGVLLDKKDIANQFGIEEISVHNGMRRGIELLKASARAGRLPQHILDALEIANDQAALGRSKVPEATGPLFELEVKSRASAENRMLQWRSKKVA